MGGTPDEPADGLGPYSAQLAIEADSPVDAVAAGLGVVQDAAKMAAPPDWPVVQVQVIDWAEFERQLEQPTHPDIIGVSELAEILDVSKQRASELARQRTFPRPFVQLASGPVWHEPTVRRFVAEWKRRPGRPSVSKTDAESLKATSQAAQNWDKEVLMRDHPGSPS